jgi:hypothetical protein
LRLRLGRVAEIRADAASGPMSERAATYVRGRLAAALGAMIAYEAVVRVEPREISQVILL